MGDKTTGEDALSAQRNATRETPWKLGQARIWATRQEALRLATGARPAWGIQPLTFWLRDHRHDIGAAPSNRWV
jgi:hypothetical protein